MSVAASLDAIEEEGMGEIVQDDLLQNMSGAWATTVDDWFRKLVSLRIAHQFSVFDQQDVETEAVALWAPDLAKFALSSMELQLPMDDFRLDLSHFCNLMSLGVQQELPRPRRGSLRSTCFPRRGAHC